MIPYMNFLMNMLRTILQAMLDRVHLNALKVVVVLVAIIQSLKLEVEWSLISLLEMLITYDQQNQIWMCTWKNVSFYAQMIQT